MLIAFEMIVRGETSWLWQFIVSNSKTVMLFGVLLMLDVILLALLMASEKQWILNIKWVVILLIVDFLLVFLILPVFYMIFRGFFPNGSFSLETVRRLFSYSLNRDALKNTLIAAFVTMILGTLQSIIGFSGLQEAYWQQMASGVMLGIFVVMQSIILSVRGKGKMSLPKWLHLSKKKSGGAPDPSVI